MDVLADVLLVSGVRSTVGARIEAGRRWSWWAAATTGAQFHAVTSGTAWLAAPGHEPVQLLPGDVVLLPAGAQHVLASDEALARTTRPESADGYEPAGPGVVRIGAGPTQAHVLCAHYEYDPAIATQVLTALPDLVHLRAGSGAGDGLEDTLRLLARELARPQAATSVVLDRLVDVVLVQVLRAWLDQHGPSSPPSWLGVLRDPVIGAAVAKLHEDPARPWTTATLAREVDVSRATLSRRFPAVVGETPAAYLARWRMDLAARRLRDTDDALAAIAASVGYTSVYAFNRAFARARSLPPGRYRATSRPPGAQRPGASIAPG